MKVIVAEDVNSALYLGLDYLLRRGAEEESRNGKVLVAPGPVVTEYVNPVKRVVWSPTRDANPFFHLFESLWMLAGRNDLAYPKRFNQRFGEYSDDGVTVWGAYGWRWREFFGYDQLAQLIGELKRNPNSRRCVLSMWNGGACVDVQSASYISPSAQESDLFTAINGGKDVPCNTHAYFDVRGDKLNMTVCCRSNDVIWGAYGANAVHFSILLEYMAEQIGVPVGTYRQFSNNYHAYLDVYDRQKLQQIKLESGRLESNLYENTGYALHMALGSQDPLWHGALNSFLEDDVTFKGVPFFDRVALPMLNAWQAHKAKAYDIAMAELGEGTPCDWLESAAQWIGRRKLKHEGDKNAA